MGKRFSVETVFSAIDKMTLPMKKIENSMNRFAGRAKQNFRSLSRVTGKVSKSMFGLAKSTVKWTAGLGIGGGVLMTMLNKSAIKSEVLAKSVGMSVQTMEALAQAIKPAGFDIEHVVDLVEEMNNKFGEVDPEKLGGVKDSFKLLGLEFENIKKLKVEEQFKVIADAALQMKDAQKAQSALDQLMGGEANKVMGVLRQRGKSIAKILEEQNKLTFRTEESRRGARQFVSQLAVLETQISSLAFHISGLAGVTVGRLVERVSDAVSNNKKTINEWLDFAMLKLDDYGVKFEGWMKSITKDDIKGFWEDIKGYAETTKEALDMLITATKAVKSVFSFSSSAGKSNVMNDGTKIIGGSPFGPSSSSGGVTGKAKKNMSLVDALRSTLGLFPITKTNPEHAQPTQSSTTTRTESVSTSEVRIIMPNGMRGEMSAPSSGVGIVNSGRLFD